MGVNGRLVPFDRMCSIEKAGYSFELKPSKNRNEVDVRDWLKKNGSTFPIEKSVLRHALKSPSIASRLIPAKETRLCFSPLFT